MPRCLRFPCPTDQHNVISLQQTHIFGNSASFDLGGFGGGGLNFMRILAIAGCNGGADGRTSGLWTW